MANFAVISPLFTHFGEKGKNAKMGPGGAPRPDTVKTNMFQGVFEPVGTQKAVSG